MILSSEHVLRAIELRMKTENILGSLCYAPKIDLLERAMMYHDAWDWEGFISNPFHELGEPIFKNMDDHLFRIFIAYSHHWNPPFTSSEIKYIIESSRKFGYFVTIYNHRASFKRDINNADLRARLRNRIKNTG